MIERVRITSAAAEVLRGLVARHGPVLLHQSGGCCEGSAPMCFRKGEFRIGGSDVLLGEVEDCPVYISAAQFEAWASSEITIDLIEEGGGDSFSLEAADGVRFATRSRVFADDELPEVRPVVRPVVE